MFSYTSVYFDNPPRTGRAIDLWIPEKITRPVALYFVHGGGWQAGHREKMHQLMHAFYSEGYPCASVCYRLGEATIPAQLSDVREGMAIAQAQLRQRGFEGPLVLYGSSAGGHLALLAGLAAPGACGDTFRGEAPPVAGVIASCAPTSFMPWENIFPGSWQSMQRAAGSPYERSPDLYRTFSPATYAGAGSPSLFFLLGECEHMFPNAHTIALVEKLQALGQDADYRVYEQAEHGFFYDITRNSQKAAFADVLNFLDKLSLPHAQA